ncbi:MAG TPA: metallophosphoesterase family protein [Ktedonobacterales bacterium]|nr:metallophosphoesterase family protein [Ktedonobacterales bacterium]
MRTAIIADMHGNLVALDAVLAEIRAEGVEQVVCLGDVAATGPQPAQVLARLRELGCPQVMGNADAFLLEPTVTADAQDQQRKIEEIDVWCAGQLSEEDRAFLAGFKPTVSVPLGEGTTLLAYHGSPRSYVEVITAETPDATLAEMFAGHQAQVFAGGHTHVQMLRRHRDTLVVNPGSVGLPMDAVPPAEGIMNAVWAEYAVVTVEGGRLEVSLRRTPFDGGALLRAADESGMPHATWWKADWRRA